MSDPNAPADHAVCKLCGGDMKVSTWWDESSPNGPDYLKITYTCIKCGCIELK